MKIMTQVLKRAWPFLFLGLSAVAVLIVARLYIAPERFDWPAWVQAVGSTAAIIAAFLITNRQHADNVLLEQIRRDSDDVRRLQAIRALMANVNTIAQAINRQRDDFYFAGTTVDTLSFLKDCEAAIRSLPVFELPRAELAIFCTNLPQAMKRLGVTLETQNVHLNDMRNTQGPSHTLVEDLLNEILSLSAQVGNLCQDEINQLRHR